MPKLVGFDLEIARIMPVDAGDLWNYAPLGITCAGLAFSGGGYEEYSAAPQLTRAECVALVRRLEALVADGWTIVTWNGCGFDFRVLAEESGLVEECGRLALGHVDLMMHVTLRKGYFLGLDKALAGAGLAGKRKSMRLSDGTIIERVGPLAPSLWAKGEREVVLTYLRADCEQTLALGEDVARRKRINWTASTGKPQFVMVNSLDSVQRCLALPHPDVAWMKNPPARADFVRWIPQVDTNL